MTTPTTPHDPKSDRAGKRNLLADLYQLVDQLQEALAERLALAADLAACRARVAELEAARPEMSAEEILKREG